MEVILVEDRPWKLKTSIKNMKKKQITVGTVVFVCQDSKKIDEASKKNIEKMKEEMKKENTELQIVPISEIEFVKTMQDYYEDAKNIILCDFNLTRGKREFFEKRVNVIFARKIMEKDNLSEPPMRVLFYTTAGETTNEQINNNFPNRKISVTKVEDNGQVILNTDELAQRIKIIEEAEQRIC